VKGNAGAGAVRNCGTVRASKAGAGTSRAWAIQDFGFFEPGFGGSTLPAFGWSPSVVFSGQTEKAGHLAQPTARAMGHNVMASLLLRSVPQHTPAR
jgi:hypothetical protein